MRILHVADDYAGVVQSSAQVRARQLGELARRQASRGHVVHVVTSARNQEWAWVDAGVKVHRLPLGRRGVDRAVELTRPDVVHVHTGARAVAAQRWAGQHWAGQRWAAQHRGNAPIVQTEWGVDLPLGVDLAPWVAAGARRQQSTDVRVLFHAGDRTAELLARWRDYPLTVIGPESRRVATAEVVLGDAPAEVFAALADDHDVYVSAVTLDPHVAGARAAGLTISPESTSLSDGWENVLAAADELYAAAVSSTASSPTVASTTASSKASSPAASSAAATSSAATSAAATFSALKKLKRRIAGIAP